MTKINELFRSFENKNILVIGDVMIDSYVWGSVTRISPEAPIPIVSASNKESRLGGAANVALNLKSLGANPILCSVVGEDDSGSVFDTLLKKRKLSNKGIIKSATRKTSEKTRIISDNQQLLRVDDEIDTAITKSIEDKLINAIKSLIKSEKIEAIIFEDYDKGSITPRLIKTVVAIANDNKIITLVDPKKRNFLEYKNVTLFKPNLKELAEGLNIDITKDDLAGVKAAAKKIRASHNIDAVMITLSENGIFVCTKNEAFVIPAEIRSISDVSGAGDTVISTISLCIAVGSPIKEASQIANIAGGLVCEKVGVVPINKEELYNECIEKLK